MARPFSIVPHNNIVRWVRLRGRTGLVSFHGNTMSLHTGILPLYYMPHRNIDIPTLEEWRIKLYDFMELDYRTRSLENQDTTRYKVARNKLKTYMRNSVKSFELIC